MAPSSKQTLDARSQEILRYLVEHYINDGQPVGSKALAAESSIALSSASIRNIMADLEAQGYLQSPYTSAGRVPTAKGYRLFIDNYIGVQEPMYAELNVLREQLMLSQDEGVLIGQASTFLSNVTKLAGVVMLPACEHLIFKHVEFLSLSQKRVLVILVVNNQDVQNRVIHTDREYSASELEQAGNYLTQYFQGKPLRQMREELFEVIKQDLKHVEKTLGAVLELAEKGLPDESEKDYVLAGETNLFEAMGQDAFLQLRELFKAFSEKRDILHLLDQCLNTEGVKIFIGEEAGYKVFDDCSVVMAPYSIQNKVVGVLGVIGPTRMPYNKVISVVDVTAKLLSQALEE